MTEIDEIEQVESSDDEGTVSKRRQTYAVAIVIYAQQHRWTLHTWSQKDDIENNIEDEKRRRHHCEKHDKHKTLSTPR